MKTDNSIYLHSVGTTSFSWCFSIKLQSVNLMHTKKILHVECELEELICNASQALRYQATS